jgi:hypothetical protein
MPKQDTFTVVDFLCALFWMCFFIFVAMVVAVGG